VSIRLPKFKTEKLAEPANQAVLFRGLPVARPIWRSFCASLAAQALIVWLGTSYMHFLAGLPDVKTPLLNARVLELDTDPNAKLRAPRIKIPDRGQASKKGAGRRAAAGPGSKGALAHQGAAPKLDANEGVPARPASAPLREFRMPEVPPNQSAPQTLVQLDLPPTLDMHPQLQVPAIVILASEVARKLKPKEFLAPPEKKRTVPVPNEVALQLGPPVFKTEWGFVKPSPIPVPDPKLPAPVGGVSPVSGVQATVPTKQAATVTGDVPVPAVNVISLPSRAIPPGQSVVLPPLNQVSARDSVSGESGLPRTSGDTSARDTNSTAGGDPKASARDGGGRVDPRAGAASERDKGGAGASGTATGAETGALARSPGQGGSGEGAANSKTGAGGDGPRESFGTGSGGTGEGPGASSDGSGSGVGANGASGTGVGAGAGAGRGSGSGPPGNSLTAPPVRIDRPVTGNYDVAVVQSGVSIPGTAGFLKGRPVYSVFLSLGGGREWILQYCLPTQERRAQRSQVVELGNIAPVTAPYAYLILKPAVQLHDGARYGFIHAFVNTLGRFDEVKEVGEHVMDNVTAVIDALRKWEFRPASKDGTAALVEVLLCIPTA
jgi:hypothetical protein